MQNLAEQLHGLGLISDKALGLKQAKEELAAAQAPIAPITVESLDSCKGKEQFNALAKVILLGDPAQIGAVVKKANRFKNPKNSKAKHFIWCWYQVKEKFPHLQEGQREVFLDRALRRKNPTFDLPV